MNIIITEVNNSKDLMRFIKFPFELYKKDPNWVPPLIFDQKNLFNPSKNPYYEHSEVQLFLAEKDSKVVGRITAHTNREHNKFHEDKIGFFGFYESLDDLEVAKALFSKASQWLISKGCDTMRGPMNLSTNDECGLLIDGFNTPPFVMMTHHLPYYDKLFTACGLFKAMDLYAHLLNAPTMPKILEDMATRIETRIKCQIRCLSKKKEQLRTDIETVFTIYQKAWEKNWGFVPMTKKEFNHMVDNLLSVVDPNMVFIAEVDGKPAGFAVALPDFNEILIKLNGRIFPFGIFKILTGQKKIKGAREITMGVVPEFQGRGIDILFYYYSYKAAIKRGIIRGEYSWVLETNTMMNRIAKHLGAKIHKTYRIYDIAL